jgi:hypothetical protein
MIHLLAAAVLAIQTTVPFDTEWQLATNLLHPHNVPTFSFPVAPAPAGTTSVTVCATIEGSARLQAVNHSSSPIWFSGGFSLRDPMSHDKVGVWRWWNATAGATFEVTKANAIMPGESRLFDVAYSVGPVCNDAFDPQPWIDGGPLKYGNFDTYIPVVCSIRDEPVGCNDYDATRRAGLEVWVATDWHGAPPMGRLHGTVIYNP